MELKDYTTEELREELKRRAKEARLNAKRSEPEYKEFTGVIEYIDQRHRGIYSYLFYIRSAIVNGVLTKDYRYNTDFKLKQGLFHKNTIPQVGDVVLLRYKRTKVNRNKEIFDIRNAKIVKIIEHGSK